MILATQKLTSCTLYYFVIGYVLDYIDSNESEQSMIALSKEALTENKKFTHMEIHPSLIFGVMCNLINFPENIP